MNKYFTILAIFFFGFSITYSQYIDPNDEFDRIASSISAIDLLTTDNFDIHETIYNYQPQIEYALVWRVRAVNTYSALQKKDVLKSIRY